MIRAKLTKRQKIILYFPFLIVPLLVLFAAYIALMLWSDENTAPVFFSLNDQKATYTIHRYEGPNYMVSYKTSKDNMEVEVGNSKIALDPFVGKNVIINGSYAGRIGKQCIVDRCTKDKVGAVIDIDYIQLVK